MTDEASWRGDPQRAGYLHTIFEESNDGILIVDPVADEIVEANPRACALLGYPRERLLSIPASQIHPHEVERFRRFLDLVGERHKGWTDELTCMTAAGRPIPVEISASVGDFDRRRCMVALIRDISDRRRAEEELQQSLEILRRTQNQRRRLLNELVHAQEEERRRIASDIRDDTIQVMSAVGMRLDVLRREIDAPGVQDAFSRLEAEVQLAIGRLRHLEFDLYPQSLDREGLRPALHEPLERFAGEAGFRYELETALVAEPPAETRAVIYRIVQGALTNVCKHARADRVEVVVEDERAGFRTHISDDGTGFSPGKVSHEPGRLGLRSMRERAELAGGWLRVISAPGSGTAVEFWVPSSIGQAT